MVKVEIEPEVLIVKIRLKKPQRRPQNGYVGLY